MRTRKISGEIMARRPGVDHESGRQHVYRNVGETTCNSPHPTKRETVKGVVRFLTCQRLYGHKNQHRAKTKEGEVWWS